jgi:fatty acid desaturase
MRRPADVRMLAFVVLHYVLLACAWIVFPLHAWTLLPLAAALAISAWICAVIAHNALHCPVFESRPARGAFQLALTCAYGFPVSEYLPGHNLSHHRHLQKAADVMRTTKSPFLGLNAFNLIAFFPLVAVDVIRQNRRYVALMARKAPRWHRQLVIETFVCWLTIGAAVALDWKRALAFVIVPRLFAVYAITTVNLFQHDGCDEDHPVNHSRNFVGKAFNWLTFNSGFHGVHHDEPGLHWSLLPEAHRRRYGGRIPPALEQPSLFMYLLRTYALSARRKRFDGTPMPPFAQSRDEDWIPCAAPDAVVRRDAS